MSHSSNQNQNSHKTTSTPIFAAACASRTNNAASADHNLANQTLDNQNSATNTAHRASCACCSNATDHWRDEFDDEFAESYDGEFDELLSQKQTPNPF